MDKYVFSIFLVICFVFMNMFCVSKPVYGIHSAIVSLEEMNLRVMKNPLGLNCKNFNFGVSYFLSLIFCGHKLQTLILVFRSQSIFLQVADLGFTGLNLALGRDHL